MLLSKVSLSVRPFAARQKLYLVLTGILTACSGGNNANGITPTQLHSFSSSATVEPQVVERGDGSQLIVFPVSQDTGALPSDLLLHRGKMWFAQSNETAIGSISRAGTVSLFAVAGGASGYTSSLIRGPKDVLWFVGYSESANSYFIAYKTASGNATEVTLPLPTGLSAPSPPCPQALAKGSDEAVWFTDPCNAAIGRVDPTTYQVTAEYQTPSAKQPESMVEGRDGDLYFIESNTDFARADPKLAGASTFITEFPFDQPGRGGFPVNLISTPKGIFFAYRGAGCNFSCNGIGTIDVGSAPRATLFASQPNSVRPNAIALGPDGNIWFSDSEDILPDQIRTMTPSGTFNGAVIPNVVLSSNLALGPDKNMWLSDSSGNIDVVVVNPQMVMPDALSLNAIGQSQALQALETGASLTVRSTDVRVAVVALQTSGTWVVTSTGFGDCTLKVRDRHDNVTDVPVSVATQN